MRINLVYHRIPHHSAHAGYDQLASHLGRRLPVERTDGLLPDTVPPAAWAPIVARAGLTWYDEWSLGLEYAAARDLAGSPNTIYHVLYGENVFRRLASLRWLAEIQGSRFVATYHQPPAIFEQVVSQPEVLRALDAVVAVGTVQAEYLASVVGPEKVFTIPHGIDTDYYRPAERSATDSLVCLCVGQWLRDFRMLAEVSDRVAAADPSITFKVIARPEDAAVFQGRSNVTIESGLSDAVLRHAYQSADLLVLPLTDCTANNAILEALACGLPIVTTAVGDIRDYVDPGCAVLVGAGDAGAMRDAILRLATDRSARLEMGRRSRRRAMDFDWSTVAEQTIALYNALAGPERP